MRMSGCERRSKDEEEGLEDGKLSTSRGLIVVFLFTSAYSGSAMATSAPRLPQITKDICLRSRQVSKTASAPS